MLLPQVLQSTNGYLAFEERRRHKVDKALSTGVLLGNRALDVGIGGS